MDTHFEETGVSRTTRLLLRADMAAVSANLHSYYTAQMAFYAEYNRLGTLAEARFRLPRSKFFRFTEEGPGRLTARLRRRIGYCPVGARWEITVSEEGRGMKVVVTRSECEALGSMYGSRNH